MEFRKTTVLPLDDAQEARHLFRQWVHDRPHVLFVVLGSGPHQEALVSKAGMFAGSDQQPRWVIWARDLPAIQEDIAQLKESTAGLKQAVLSGQARAFVLSLGDAIHDVVTVSETADNVRVNLAYMRAEVLP
ncbi:MAG: hypothetical protein ABW123_18240 [Cystobacter sp.]